MGRGVAGAAAVLGLNAAEMMEAILGRGACRTLQGHVQQWGAVERWCRERGAAPYPPALAVALGYAAARAKKGCGPAVTPSIRGTVGWVRRRLGMVAPDLAAEPHAGD